MSLIKDLFAYAFCLALWLVMMAAGIKFLEVVFS